VITWSWISRGVATAVFTASAASSIDTQIVVVDAEAL